jgi:hypothetical protein
MPRILSSVACERPNNTKSRKVLLVDGAAACFCSADELVPSLPRDPAPMLGHLHQYIAQISCFKKIAEKFPQTYDELTLA